MAKKRYRPLDDFNESIIDAETDQLQNLDFNNPIRKRRREVTPQRVVETQEDATALGRVYDQQAGFILNSATLPGDGLLPSTDYFQKGKHLINKEFLYKKEYSLIKITPFKGFGLGINCLF